MVIFLNSDEYFCVLYCSISKWVILFSSAREIKFVGANCCSRGRFCVCVQHIILCCDTWPMELICISLWKRDLTHPSLVCRRMSRHIIRGSIYVGNVPFGFECSENCVWCCCHLFMYTLRVTLLFSLCIWFCVAERPSARRPARHKRRARARMKFINEISRVWNLNFPISSRWVCVAISRRFSIPAPRCDLNKRRGI